MLTSARSLCVALVVTVQCGISHGAKAQDYVPGEVLVALKKDAPANAPQTVFSKTKLGAMKYFEHVGVYHLAIPLDQTVEEALVALAAEPHVASASPNYYQYPVGHLTEPNDPLYARQWHLNNTGQRFNNYRHTDTGANATWFDAGEIIYDDVNDDGQVSVGDVRLTATGAFAAGSVVAAGDADIGTALSFVDQDGDGAFDAGEPGFRGLDRYFDANGNGQYDAGECIYYDNPTTHNALLGTGLGRVSNGPLNAAGNRTADQRLTACGAFAAGSWVAAGDADIGNPLTSFASGGLGIIDADIDAPQGWEHVTDCSDIVVAILDTGLDVTHPDLAGNLWVNPNDPAGGGDQDGNGIIDDVNGAEFVGMGERYVNGSRPGGGGLGALFDNGEWIIMDNDADRTISIGDRRITTTLAGLAAGSIVAAGNGDIGANLADFNTPPPFGVAPVSNVERHADGDGNLRYTLGETIYIDTNGNNIVDAGDWRRTPILAPPLGPLPIARVVAADADAVAATPIINFFRQYTGNLTDYGDHGTAVAGCVGARGNNGIDVAGVCWRVQLMGVRIAGAGSATTADIIAGINYIIAQKAAGVNVRVINHSFGGIGYSGPGKLAIAAAIAAPGPAPGPDDDGILFVTSAGNSGFDNDAGGQQAEGIYTDTNGNNRVEVGEARLTTVGQPGSQLAPGAVVANDADVGTTLVAFQAFEKHTEAGAANGTFQQGEHIYRDLDRPVASNTITAGDIRLRLFASGGIQYGRGAVVLGDPDITAPLTALVPFAANEKHAEKGSGDNRVAGNAPGFPCAYDTAGILCVGATDNHDNITSFSNFGTTSVDVNAPGENILTLRPANWGGGVQYIDGTSFSSPITAGIAAHFWSLPGFETHTVAQIKTRIMTGFNGPVGQAHPHGVDPRPGAQNTVVAGINNDGRARVTMGDDFGDAPDMPYPTKLQGFEDGARHEDIGEEWLGRSTDLYPAGWSDVSPEFDAFNNALWPQDPDGFSFFIHPFLPLLFISIQNLIDHDFYDDGIDLIGPFVFSPPFPAPPNWASVRVWIDTENNAVTDFDGGRYGATAHAAGDGVHGAGDDKYVWVNGFFDWNGDGDWDDFAEHVFTLRADPSTWAPGSSGGVYLIDFPMPETPVPMISTDWWARFRLDYGENLGHGLAPPFFPVGPSAGGLVDYWDFPGLPFAPGFAGANRYESVAFPSPQELDLTYGLAQFGEVEDYTFTVKPPKKPATDIPEGIDLWHTPGGMTTFQDFTGDPIPAGFFGVGSDPFTDTVYMHGVPLSTSAALGNTDTIVERLMPAEMPTCPQSEDSVPIAIRALSLEAATPITVSYNGGATTELWNATVSLSQSEQPLGLMTIHAGCGEGGTFESVLQVLPKFIFTRVSDGTVVEMDTGQLGMDPIEFTGDGSYVYQSNLNPAFHVPTAPFGVDVDTNGDGSFDLSLPATSDFVTGIDPGLTCDCNNPGEQEKRMSFEEALWASHGVVTPQFPGDNDDCLDKIRVGEGIFAFDTTIATPDGPTLTGCVPPGADIWYNYVSSCDGAAIISTCGSSFDTVLDVFDGCDCALVGDATLIDCNDDSCGFQSEIKIPSVTPGSCYKIRIGGFGGATGLGSLTITCLPNTCEPGTHWVDIISHGTDIMETGALVGLDLNLDCSVDTNLVLTGPVIVDRSNPLDDSVIFAGTRPVDGHLDVIDTEIVNMSLTGSGITLTAGAGLGAGGVLGASRGAIHERDDDPALADSFFMVMFEVDLGGGLLVYNQVPLLLEASELECVPPEVTYFHPIGQCIPLYDSPIPGDGMEVARLVTARHITGPIGACCTVDGCTDTTQVSCASTGGVYLGDSESCATAVCPTACTCDGDVNEDGSTNVADLASVFSCLGQEPTGSCALMDVTCNGVIDAADQDAVSCLMNGDPPEVCCPGTEVEACCLPDLSCLDTTNMDCYQQGGTTQGVGIDCASITCTECRVDAECDDGNACTTDFCDGGGTCVHVPEFDDLISCCNPSNGNLTPIDNGDPCLVGICDPLTGTVSPLPAPHGTVCDDGDVCTALDECDGAGACVGTPADQIPCVDDFDCQALLPGTASFCDTPIPAGFCVCAPAPVSNDDCLSAATIADGITSFDSTGATTTGQPDPLCGFFGNDQLFNDLYYTYTATCTGNLTVNTCGSSFDTKLAIHDGCGCPPPAILGCNDDACGSQSELIVPVFAGNCYLIRVGAFGITEAGPGTLTIQCQGIARPIISLVPVSASGSHTIVGDEIILHEAGTSVTLDLFLSVSQSQIPPGLNGFQATIDSAGYTSGTSGSLSPVPSGSLIDTGRADYVFFGLTDLSSVDTSTPDYAYFGALLFDCMTTDVVDRYIGQLQLQTNLTALGTFTIGGIPDPNSVLSDCDLFVNYDPLYRPVRITVAPVPPPTGQCCFGIGTSNGCVEGLQEDACAAFPAPTLWLEGGVCGAEPLPDCSTVCLSDAECDDGIFCNGVEACFQNQCVEAHDPCPDQVCNEADQQCFDCLADGDCDDGNECTSEGCEANTCIVLAIWEGTSCSGGAGVCIEGQCTLSATTCAVNEECDDGLFCNGVETCDPVLGCLSGKPPVVDDGIFCTEDICDEGSDQLLHLPNDALCDDGIGCTDDVCDVIADCMNFPLDSLCDDANECTIDFCDPGADCQNFPNEGAPCAGGTGVCVGGVCQTVGDCIEHADCAGVDLAACTIEKCIDGSCVTGPFVSGDIDKDGGSGLQDLLLLLGILGGAPENPNADVNGDGITGLGDLLDLLGLLGGAPPICP